MRRPLPYALAATILCSCVAAAGGSQTQQSDAPASPITLAITGVSVVDVVAGATVPGRTVLLAGERIAEVGHTDSVRVPQGVRVVDGSGRFLIPGLWDMHSHAVSFGRAALPLYLTQGVTGIRDMGAERFAEAKALRDSIAGGAVLGPRMRIAGPVMENANWLATVKGWNDKAGTRWTLYERFGPQSPDQAVRWVDSVAAVGADHIKVRNWPAPDISSAVIERARERGLPVYGHGNEPFPREGVTTLEHGVWPPLAGSGAARDSLWQQLATNGVYFTPTLVTWPIRLATPDDAIARIDRGDVAGLQYVPAATRQDWRDKFTQLKQEQPVDWTEIHRGEMRNVGEMHRAGITLLAGSDIGAPLLVPGFSMHDELELLVRIAGMTPLDALRAATISAARAMGAQASVGSIEPGKLADLVLLDADPLVDISNTRRILAVIANGRLLERTELDRMLAEVEANARRSPGS